MKNGYLKIDNENINLKINRNIYISSKAGIHYNILFGFGVSMNLGYRIKIIGDGYKVLNKTGTTPSLDPIKPYLGNGLILEGTAFFEF